MSTKVEGSVALVTGANRGIGLEIVKSLLSAGASKVYAAVRRPDSAQFLTEEFGGRISIVPFDLTDEAVIQKAAETASDAKIVVCNAGVLNTSTVFSDDVYQAFDFMIEGNVKGLLRAARAFAPVLKKNGGGALVQLNSVVSVKNFPEFTTYCASKAAAYSITQALKFQLAEQGTAVHSVHPGPIATDMADSAGFSEIAEPASLVGEAVVAALESGEFHVWPDTMAKQIGSAYASFGTEIVEAEMSAG